MTLQAPAPTVTAPDFTSDHYAWGDWWIETNGHIFREFERLVTDRLQQRPDARISADMVLHVIRWNTDIRGEGEPVSINNNASSLCARLYIALYPAAARNFEIRRSWIDDLRPSDWSNLTFKASRVKKPVDLGPLFGGRA